MPDFQFPYPIRSYLHNQNPFLPSIYKFSVIHHCSLHAQQSSDHFRLVLYNNHHLLLLPNFHHSNLSRNFLLYVSMQEILFCPLKHQRNSIPRSNSHHYQFLSSTVRLEHILLSIHRLLQFLHEHYPLVDMGITPHIYQRQPFNDFITCFHKAFKVFVCVKAEQHMKSQIEISPDKLDLMINIKSTGAVALEIR